MSVKQNAQRELRKRYGVRYSMTPKRCPNCGTLNHLIEPTTRVCRVCKEKEMK